MNVPQNLCLQASNIGIFRNTQSKIATEDGPMPRRAFQLICFLAYLGIVVLGRAQEGHPLTGTWSGDWGLTATQRNHVTFVMNWDGKSVSGIMNPGPNAVPLGSVFVDVTNWTVRIEADAKDPSGKPVHIAAEGRLEDIGSYHRKITGAWRQGATNGDFKITRD
jgi:hypothetical protein